MTGASSPHGRPPRSPSTPSAANMLFSVISALAVVSAIACGGPTDPSKNTPETFPGSVQPLQFGPLHTFNEPTHGEITVTVNTMTPGNAFLGGQYGQPFGGGCSTIQQNVVSSSNLGRTA